MSVNVANEDTRIAFACGECGKVIRAKRELAGRRGHCTTCKAPVRVPGSRARTSPPRGRVTTCDLCAEEIRVDAERCRHCGESRYEQDPMPDPAQELLTPGGASVEAQVLGGVIAALPIIFLVLPHLLRHYG
jgi:hypothetical protein